MKIGRRATLAELDAKGWATFASCAVPGLPFIRRRIAEIGQAIKVRAQEMACTLLPGLDEAVLSPLAERVADRAERCARTDRK